MDVTSLEITFELMDIVFMLSVLLVDLGDIFTALLGRSTKIVVVVVLLPSAFVVFNVTVYTPVAVYVCTGF